MSLNYQSILNIVLSLVGKRDELVAIVRDAMALWNRVKGIAPQLEGLAKDAGLEPMPSNPPPLDINWLQTSLNTLVNAGLKIDGSYGAATQAAVKKFQQSKGLTPDGWAGVQTQAAIVDALGK